LVLAVANIRLKASFHALDDGVLWESRAGAVVAKRIDPEGPAAAAGLRKGDVLLAIDGSPIATPEAVQEVLDRVPAFGGGATEGSPRLSYQVLRLNVRQALTVSVRPLPRGAVGPYYYLAAVGIFSLIVGTVVYLRRRGAPAVAHFYLLCLFWCLAYSFSYTGKLDFWDALFYWLDGVGVVFFPAVFFHFALAFPERKPLLDRRWLLPAVYLPSFLLIYLTLGAKLAFFARVPWGDAIFLATSDWVDRVTPIYAAALSLAAFFAFVDSYRRARSITRRKQTKWIVWGTGFGILPFTIFYALPYLAGVSPGVGGAVSVGPLALIPLSFAYAIVKYRLMDVEILFKRGVVYTLATAVVIGLYLAIFLAGTHYLVADPHSTIIALLATMVVVLAFTPVKSKIQVAIDRMFYKDRYDYRRALLRLSRDLNADLDLQGPARVLVERIGDTFGIDQVALLAAPARGADLEVLAARGLGTEELSALRIASHTRLQSRLALGAPFIRDDLERSGPRATAPEDNPLAAYRLPYAVPCVTKGEVVGVILLGRRRDDNALSSEDMDLLLTVSSQAATALENARLYRSLARKAGEFERLKQHSDNVIESLSAGILVLDLSGQVVRWNRALEQLYQLPREEALGRPLEQIFPASFRDLLESSMGERWWASAEASGVHKLNLENLGGEKKVVKLQVAPFVSEGGETQGTILIFEDITERVEMEEQLQLREKMASLGLLAAGVAHEVNTPLTGISSFTQMLREQTEGDDPRVRLLEKIERQTERASKIVNNLLHFARQGSSDFLPVDLNVVVTDVLSLLDHQLERSKIKVRRELAPNLPRLLGDENKLQQIFLNLILNARDAMPSGGWLTISTSANRSYVIAEVADTGHGISKEDIKRIYDPFFTTKKTGAAGTGLGLSISYGIVQEHAGHISVDSVPGKGTRFEIRLPALDMVRGELGSGIKGRSTRARSG
jgi:hypothetical protein